MKTSWLSNRLTSGKQRFLLVFAVALLALAAVAGLTAWLSGSANASHSGGLNLSQANVIYGQAPAAPLPAATCSLNAGVRTCEFWAVPGTLTMPDGLAVPVWGFTDTPTGTAQVPGPTIIAEEGETLEVIVHNDLPGETLALNFNGQDQLVPDLAGVASGAIATYTFDLTKPGTSLYEAGLTENGSRQVMMGLYGAMIVRPIGAPTQAYAAPETAFDNEALLVFSELDPNFNVDPNGFHLNQYAPKYWLINGQPYPAAERIDAFAGQKVLLRYLNATGGDYSIGLLGNNQQVIGFDGEELVHPYESIAEAVSAGYSKDVLVTVPSTTVTGTVFTVYHAALDGHNSNYRTDPAGPLDFGGILTFINVAGGPLAPLPGPKAVVGVSPSPTVGDTGATLQATIDGGGVDVVAAEFFIDMLGAPGTGTAFAVTPGPVVNVSHDFTVGDLAGWLSGHFKLYVRGLDANGDWGPANSAVLVLDKDGPASTGIRLLPNPTNGTRDVDILATGDDHDTGRSNVVASVASFNGGPNVALNLNHTIAPWAAITGTITAADLAALPSGLYDLAITSQDALGNWGATGVAQLTLDKKGPVVDTAALSQGVIDFTSGTVPQTVRLTATMTDAPDNGALSNIVNIQGWFGDAGPEDSGFDMFPKDGMFNSPTESAYYEIPIINFSTMAQGTHTMTVRGLDAAGNWGDIGTATFEIIRAANDNDGPTISGQSVAPSPTNGAATVNLTALATDVDLVSNITAGEWWIGSDPGYGQGFPMNAADGAFDSPTENLAATINVSGFNNGWYALRVRAQDAAGHWGRYVALRLRVTGNTGFLILTDGFENDLGLWDGLNGAVGLDAAAAMDQNSAQGLLVQASADPAYLRQRLPAGEQNYKVAFDLDASNLKLNGDTQTIFSGQDYAGQLFGLDLEESPSAEGTFEMRAWVTDKDGVKQFMASQHLADAPHKIELVWRTFPKVEFSLFVDGVEVETLSGFAAPARMLQEVRLGPSTVTATSMTGALYFDNFTATRDLLAFLPLTIR